MFLSVDKVSLKFPQLRWWNAVPCQAWLLLHVRVFIPVLKVHVFTPM